MLALIFADGGIAHAAEGTTPAESGPLLITLGTNAVYSPRFEGSKRHDLGPWPIIGWRRDGDKEWLDFPTDGLDFSLIETENFRMGPVGFWRWQRDNSTIQPRGFTRFGKGHSSIDLSVEAGVFAEYWPVQWLRTRVELREAVLGATGLVANLASDLVWRPTSSWTLSAGPRLSIADGRFMQDYYGINASQSFTSGLPTYSPGAGVRSLGGAALARYKITPAWTTQAFVDYQHLSGPAGDSPVIATRGTREQYIVGMGLSYTFKAPW